MFVPIAQEMTVVWDAEGKVLIKEVRRRLRDSGFHRRY